MKKKNFDGVDLLVFQEELSKLILLTPMLAGSLRHETPLSTIRDYSYPEAHSKLETKMAVEFLRDLTHMSTSKMLGKWYRSNWRAKFSTPTGIKVKPVR